MVRHGKRAAVHSLRVESLERRQLLAVDLAVVIDPVSDGADGENTRVVRVFNNGDSTATDAVIRLDSSTAFEDASWSRRPGAAQVRHQRALLKGSTLSGNNFPSPTAFGDVNQDGLLDYILRGRDGTVIVRGRQGLDLESTSAEMLDSVIADEASWTISGFCGSVFELPSDLNQDGFQDFAIDCYADPVILYGGPDNLVDGEPLNGSQVKSFVPSESSGLDIVNSGDFNGDGFDDVLLHSVGPFYDDTSLGRELVEVVSVAQVVWGRSDLSDFPVLDPEQFAVTLAVRSNHSNGPLAGDDAGCKLRWHPRCSPDTGSGPTKFPPRSTTDLAWRRPLAVHFLRSIFAGQAKW